MERVYFLFTLRRELIPLVEYVFLAFYRQEYVFTYCLSMYLKFKLHTDLSIAHRKYS